jgi:ATP-binding cassette subfamily C protein LapB
MAASEPEAKVADSGPSINLSALSTLRSNAFDLVVASLFLNILNLVMPLSLLQVYDRILPDQSTSTMVMLLIVVLAALVLESFISYGRTYMTSWAGARFEHRATCLGLNRLLNSSLHIFEREGAGVHLDRMGSLGTVRDFYAGQALLTLLDLPFAILYLAMIAFLGGILVLVPIVMLVTFALGAVKIGERLRKAIQRRMIADDRRFNFLIEVLGGIHSVKAMAMEAQMVRRYERLQESCAQGNHDVALESTMALSLSSFFSQATMILVASFGSVLVVHGNLTVGGLAACSMLAGRALTPIQKALGVWTRFQTFVLARQRIQDLFAIPEEAVPGLPALPTVKGRLTLKEVSFRFDKSLPPVIHDATMDVAAGECVAISGGNGSGKTTLLTIMQGALAASSGQVLVDGNDISLYDPRTVRAQIAYLPQSGVLFQGTILQNLTMFRPALDDVAVETAALLGLDEVVATMAYGFDTQVGDGAYDSLPRGIKQRIAITRALVDNPKIVLFDEANTAIDTTGDNFLRVWLERSRGKRTLVLVTHRPSLLKLADRIFDLEGGTVTERPPRVEATEPAALAPTAPQDGPPPSGGGVP